MIMVHEMKMDMSEERTPDGSDGVSGSPAVRNPGSSAA